jgi:anti-sigma regulatory factor (Ser/Thr protein kinase)
VENHAAPIEKAFAPDPAVLHEVRDFVRARARASRFRPQVVDDLVLAVSEACANVLRHTNSVEIRVTWDPHSGDEVEVRVLDTGVFLPPDPATKSQMGGFGIPLMAALVDELRIEMGTSGRPGTAIRLIKRRERRDTG